MMISEKTVIEKIEACLMPIIGESGLELVEVEFRPSGKRWLLRIYIDKEGGVTIDDCAWVSRELGIVLDVEDIIEHPYRLEVSSPGLTRKLTRREDFVRYRGKRCRIITTESIAGRNEFIGEIGNITDDGVEISEKIDIFTIPICAIKRAHLEIEM
ncbi:MAG: ribosome maturation factor RimP [Syntrophorhabdaceae bacterium]|nr:ribosome maturation factor RimP [Syntrophorhabdaceae bacterium]